MNKLCKNQQYVPNSKTSSPSATILLVLIIDKIGFAKAQKRMNVNSKANVMLGLPVFATSQGCPYRPGSVPMAVMTATASA